MGLEKIQSGDICNILLSNILSVYIRNDEMRVVCGTDERKIERN